MKEVEFLGVLGVIRGMLGFISVLDFTSDLNV